MIERFHRYLKQRLVVAAIDNGLDLLGNANEAGDEWASLIPPIVFAYNSTVNRMTGHSPHELIFNRSPRFPIDLALNLKVNDVQCDGCINEYRQQLAAHQRAIFLNSNVTQDVYDQRRKADYDHGRSEFPLEVGEHVTLYNSDNKVGKQKFSPKWRGIWRVTKKYGPNAVEIEDLTTKHQQLDLEA